MTSVSSDDVETKRMEPLMCGGVVGSDQLFSSVTFHRRMSTAQQQCRLVPKCSVLMAMSEKKKDIADIPASLMLYLCMDRV